MAKALFITEKPSVASQFAKALDISGAKRDGYMESEHAVVTWCVGHLVTLCYPESYDKALKVWSLETLPFLPKEYKYEVIPSVQKQFEIVKILLNREDVDRIYVCTDSGREGEYIYRLVDKMAGVTGKVKKRVWIDSQTDEEIKRGVKEAKALEEYDNLAAAAYLRAKEDYMTGINFSRLLTLVYGNIIPGENNGRNKVIAVGRVMTCVLGMVVLREREIRNFQKTLYYKINARFSYNDALNYTGEWKAVEGSKYFQSPLLFNDNGFKTMESARNFIKELWEDKDKPIYGVIESVIKKEEKKNAPLLFNLAELQSECSKRFKISPDETLSAIQALYEKKLLTYPRTDARVISTAVAKEIHKNLKGLTKVNAAADKILNEGKYKNIVKSRYVDDSKITDHYAIIPTGDGIGNLQGVADIQKKIYYLVVNRFLAIFYPPAIFKKVSVITCIENEKFFTSEKICVDKGYMEILNPEKSNSRQTSSNSGDEAETNEASLVKLRKGQKVGVGGFDIKEAETTPPSRYTSGSIILAMENAGKLIEDEELREQIKGSGIGTSATRAEILKKLQNIDYVQLNKKTQVLSPTIRGELIFEVVKNSIPDLLEPRLTASWEKGLDMVAKSEVQPDTYMGKLESYVRTKVKTVLDNKDYMRLRKILVNVYNQGKIGR